MPSWPWNAVVVIGLLALCDLGLVLYILRQDRNGRRR
jgi:hypothetical protein